MDNDLNISELNRNLQESFIHYEPNRIDFTISNIELDLLEQSGSNIWKDVFFVTLGLGLPSLLNALSSKSKLSPKEVWTEEIFLNFLIAGISLTLSLLSLIIWQKNNESFKKTINQIKNKPRFRLPNTQ